MTRKPRVKKLPESKVTERNDSQKIISYSQYSKWKSCPRSWKLGYIDKIKIPDPSIHAVFGTAIHECLQHWITVMYTTTIKEANEIDFGSLFLERLKENYKKEIESFGSHFSTKEEMAEFYSDGLTILEWIKKKRSSYFSPKDELFVGEEVPILISPDLTKPNVLLMGYLDLIIFDEYTQKYIIFDIKTSTRGWSKWDKANKVKTSQLLLYKIFFSEQYNIPIEQLDVEYFIVRRKIDEESEFPQKRVQQYSPSQGSVSINRVKREFQEFIDTCFTTEGYNTDIEYPAITGEKEWNCKFCPYNNEDHCPKANRRIS